MNSLRFYSRSALLKTEMFYGKNQKIFLHVFVVCDLRDSDVVVRWSAGTSCAGRVLAKSHFRRASSMAVVRDSTCSLRIVSATHCRHLDAEEYAVTAVKLKFLAVIQDSQCFNGVLFKTPSGVFLFVFSHCTLSVP